MDKRAIIRSNCKKNYSLISNHRRDSTTMCSLLNVNSLFYHSGCTYRFSFLLAVRLSCCYYRRLLCPARLVRSVVCLSRIPSFHRWNDVDHFASSCWTLPLFSTVLWLFRFVQLFRFFIAFQQYIFSVQ